MKRRALHFGLASLYLFAVSLTAFTPRLEFELLLIGVFIAFAVWCVFLSNMPKIGFLLLVALLVRTVFFLALPSLSDDFYRFIWDGQLLLQGINPIGKVPSLMEVNLANDTTLLKGMNSRDYPSVYPPLHQLGMAFGSLFTGFLSQVNGMRIFIVGCEAIGLVYFWRFSKDILALYALYLLNPLVAIEGVGNVHFEAALLPFLAIAIDQVRLYNARGAAFSLSLAVLIKLNPLILVPAFFNEKNGRRITLVSFAIVAAGFLPFAGGLPNLLSGIDLFFRNFEFNASIYYLLSAMGEALLGYNPVSVLGPALGLISAMLMVAVGLSRAEMREKALLIYLIFLFFSSTVHPWYIIPVVYFSLLTQRKALLIWSFTAFFSYSHYLGIVEPKYNWLIAEYVLLLVALLYEYRRRPIQLFRG